MIRVAIVEDNAVELASFIEELSSASDVTVVASAPTAAAAAAIIPASRADVVLVDHGLPDGTGASVITQLSVQMENTAFVILSAYEDYDRIYQAIVAGAVGYLGKVYAAGELARNVREVYAGGSPISSPIARKVLQAFHLVVKPTLPMGTLTKREQEVLHIFATGTSYQDTADKLCISLETVRTHIRNIYKKLHVNSRKELMQKGWRG
jgi:DNA-binding NarL/FixJ family response regulator